MMGFFLSDVVNSQIWLNLDLGWLPPQLHHKIEKTLTLLGWNMCQAYNIFTGLAYNCLHVL
jgi:hypothetical protein